MLRSLLISLALLLIVPACATQSATPATKVAAARRQPPAGCVPDTATRLPPLANDCAGFGQSYDQQQIKSTGYTNVGQALSTLDPAVTSSGR
jgi:hypothetical protein